MSTMMNTIRHGNERGHTKMSWLESRHSFSFDQYFDKQHMSFGPLRVINEDWVKAGAGFPTHPHRDMEIITYVIDGAIEHKDSLGTGSVIRPGEIQKMSAGSGILHSEFNPSKDQGLHLLQIWIVPAQKGLTPAYEQKSYTLREGEFTLLGGPNTAQTTGQDGEPEALVTIHQDVRLYAYKGERGTGSKFTSARESRFWLQIVKGNLLINGKSVKAGDGLALSDAAQVEIECLEQSELLLFEIGEALF